MKTVLLLLSVFTTSFAWATIINVNNNVNSPGQYTNLQTAIDNANQGDTIYVAGSSTTYGNIVMNKSLKLFGAGFNNPNGLNTTIGTIALGRVNASTGANNSKISGVVCGNITLTGSFTGGTISTNLMNDITIERCRFNNTRVALSASNNAIDYSNFSLKNNVFNMQNTFLVFSGSTTNSIYDNCIIENNIFDGGVFDVPNPNIDVSAVLFRNNIFINKTVAAPSFTMNASNPYPGPTFNNNIFYGVWPEGCVNCAFNNNITYFNNDDHLVASKNPGSVGSGNIIGQNPQFVNYPAGGGAFSFAHDYNLQPASPGKNAGTDASDIGVFGGSSPVIPGTNPYIPQMQNITFPLGSSVGVGTNLNVNFNSYKQD
jgi:hypothetical protein